MLRRHRHDQRQLEALLFGQAGFLAENEETATDEYIRDLRQEHEFLRHKYSLGAAALAVHEWNYLRLRPANFPPVRLGQLAGLLHARPALFDALLTAQSVAALTEFFQAPAPDVLAHALPARPARARCPAWAKAASTCSSPTWWCRCAWPTPATWASPTLVESSVALLSELPAEHNQYTDVYEALGFAHRTAADSQGLLALHKSYCAPRRCLHCAIGSRLVQQPRAGPMKIALAIVLNCGLAGRGCCRGCGGSGAGRRRVVAGVLVLGLGLRLAAGPGSRHWHLALDAEFMSWLSRQLTAQLWAAAGRSRGRLLTLGSDEFHFEG